MSYDPVAVLATIDRHALPLILLFGLTWACQFAWWVAAIRTGRRDRAYPLPLSCALIWLAHDVSYDLHFRDWFVVYDHWFLKAFWVGMVITAFMEVYFIRCVWTYGRAEILPDRSPTERAVLLALAAIGVGVIFWVAKSVTADPLYLYAPGLTLVMYAPLGTAMLLQRGSARGQSVGMWLGYVAMVIVYWTACVGFIPEVYANPEWVALGASGALWGLVTARWVRAAGSRIEPATQPEPASFRPVP